MTDAARVVQIDLQEFEDWLRTKPEEAVVGEARSPVSDALANFLAEQEGHAALVGRERVRVRAIVSELPEWAQQYLRLMDTAASFSPITTREALYALDQVKRLMAAAG